MDVVDCRTTKQKIEDARATVKQKLKEGWAWVKDNKDILIIAIPAVGGIVVGTTKVIGKAVNNHKAERIKNTYVYDPSLGFYWPMKRALTGAEKLEFERRRNNGESTGEILRSFGVLKK